MLSKSATLSVLGLLMLFGPMLQPAFAADDAAPGIGPRAEDGTVASARPTKEVSFGNLMIVYFEEPGLAQYMGDVPGLEATSPRARGGRKLDATAPASRAYLGYLEQRQDEHLNRIEVKLGRPVEPIFRYRAVVSGVALAVSRAEGKLIEKIPGVLRVVPDRVQPLETDRGPLWIGADKIWDGSATGGLPGTHGEGIVSGVIDSGVNMDHPSFAEVGGDGYTHTNPNGSGNFIGWCDPAHPNHDPSYVCNDKLIGAWDYTDAFCAANPTVCSETDGPEDDNGHGSHTTSTVAGNVLLSPAISGVAPHANLIVYDACYTDTSGQGLCPFTATSAAADQAVLDGVDTINYSIGGGDAPWGGDIDTFFLENYGNGTFVAASAGNDGPNTVSHLGPWVATSGASTHDRVNVFNELIDMSGGISPPGDITGASRTDGYGPESIVYAGDYVNGDPDPEQCLNPFPANTWTAGEIVLCDRGTIARVAKCANVAAGGAGGCVLANADATQTAPVADPHVIPAIHVDFVDGNTLRAWLASGSGHMATITTAEIVTDPSAADIMASFSSTGPNSSFSVVKPDVTNPGVDIFAAWNTDGVLIPPEFATISGTSMSSPHTSGSGALLKALYPAWSPAAIKSALMMTADTTVLKFDGATPADLSDYGAGRVDLTKAALVGLVVDETYEAFLAADPQLGGNPEELNLASLQQNACVGGSCQWQRTFTAPTSTTAANWAISFDTPLGVTMMANPSNFGISPGNFQMVDFDIDAPSLDLGTWAYAEVVLTPDNGSPVLHLPVAVKAEAHNFPDQQWIATFDLTGSVDIEGLQFYQDITDLTIDEFGLTQATQTDVELFEDPTNGDPYDNLSQVFWKTVSVQPGSLLLTASTESDEAPDVDLFVGTGGVPSAATQQCASTSATASELCEISSPASGTWWILVQNWSGSASQPDLIALVDGVVPPTDSGNMVVSGPSTVAAGDPFTLNLAWDLTSSSEALNIPSDLWIGAFSVAKDGVTAPFQTVSVTLEIYQAIVFSDDFETGNTSAWGSSVP